MSQSPFITQNPNVLDNHKIRTPQKESFHHLQKHMTNLSNGSSTDREVGIVLPVGCGKSGLITLAPFAFKSKRTLVIAPGVNIADQLHDAFDPTKPNLFFYQKCSVLTSQPFPEPVRIQGTSSNLSDLQEAHVVVSNIQQLQGTENRWLSALPVDFFDLILVDEAHHNVAESWVKLRKKFPAANIVNFSATPKRADGQLMAGKILYFYPVFQAIQAGYIKRIKAIRLNPKSLRYVREEDGKEIEVDLEEVKRMGEEDAGFRRSIVTSKETLKTIVDASIQELEKIRKETGDAKHKIIASALNHQHCIQITEAYNARGKSAAYVHSKEDSKTNERIFAQLNDHKLDVIVQVRKLGEGFDHSYLSVAAIFSIFRELSPFVQFVGRIMRVIKENDPTSILNQGTVIFHAGAGVAQQWDDFKDFSQADQDFFDQLMPTEDLDFTDINELEVIPVPRITRQFDIRSQGSVHLEEIQLLDKDEEAKEAFEVLKRKGFSPEEYKKAFELTPCPTTKVKERQAGRMALNDHVKNEAGKILGEFKLNPMGYDLDKTRTKQSNLVVIKSSIDKKINSLVKKGTKERSEFSKQDLDKCKAGLPEIITQVKKELNLWPDRAL